MIGRRAFLGAAGAAALGRACAATDRIAIACIGVGWQGENNVRSFLEMPDVRVVAVCDIDSDHLERARAIVNEKYGDRGCAVYSRFEEALARPDIDAVMLALPDHWHGIASVAAAAAGKDIYGEKPIAHTFADAAAIRDAVARFGCVWQTGSWQRSVAEFRFACELVRNGRIGKVTRVEVGLRSGHTDFDGLGNQTAPVPPPKTLDYQRWLGPAPEAFYCPARVHKTWRWNSDYGGGMLMDWVGHHVDTAHWGLGLDESGPLEVEGVGEFSSHPVWNTATRFRVAAAYPGGVAMVIAGGYDEIRSGVKWIGEAGWVWVDRNGIDAEPKSLLTSRIGPREVRLPRSPGHHREFVDCMRTRGVTLTPPAVALRSTVPGYLGTISMQLGRKIRWDPVRQMILDDPVAARMLTRPMRSPWRRDGGLA